MKIPIFDEIIVKRPFDEDGIKKLVLDSRMGRVPCYINLLDFTSSELRALIPMLEKVILDLRLHPKFPYPIYLIVKGPINSLFPKFKDLSELPMHFFKKVKRPNNKNLQLLNKLSLKVDKIKHLDLFKINNRFKDTGEMQKKLYCETKELLFLEQLNDILIEEQKEKNKRPFRSGRGA